MRNLEVYIECNGNMINVGSITGHNSDDAVFYRLMKEAFHQKEHDAFLKVFYQKDIQEGVLRVGFMLMKMIIYQFFQN